MALDIKITGTIWVWLYDWGPHTHPEMWENGCTVQALPQAHTYAFLTEEEAKAHPERMGWNKDHGYILQKVYLWNE
jgi:hypothetical protein